MKVKNPQYMGYTTRKMKIVGSHESITEIALTNPPEQLPKTSQTCIFQLNLFLGTPSEYFHGLLTTAFP